MRKRSAVRLRTGGSGGSENSICGFTFDGNMCDDKVFGERFRWESALCFVYLSLIGFGWLVVTKVIHMCDVLCVPEYAVFVMMFGTRILHCDGETNSK